MCIGGIDGTHIPILAPSENGNTYVNRKGVHSIVTQAIVDSQGLFTNIVLGWPGSVHDARVFSNSTIYENAKTGTLFSGINSKDVSGQQVGPLFIADPAYPLLSWLMRPYKENSLTTRSERHFNHCLRHTFGRWKGRFRRLAKRVDMKVAYVTTVVAASCILHNICEMQNNPFLPYWEQDVQPDDTDKSATLEVQDGDATQVRDSLAMYFSM
ncbi:putative nuclease HARBI1 [Exaiptasia diaphana]|uniref:Putative nuclease HARBI1 n=1 Tax=Exaiptasia diaphana TaxID=2652724 RepID=A0A913YH37_EXADI|nr:putative nuclease HARBI1 [Exaiptasia diaphana]